MSTPIDEALEDSSRAANRNHDGDRDAVTAEEATQALAEAARLSSAGDESTQDETGSPAPRFRRFGPKRSKSAKTGEQGSATESSEPDQAGGGIAMAAGDAQERPVAISAAEMPSRTDVSGANTGDATRPESPAGSSRPTPTRSRRSRRTARPQTPGEPAGVMQPEVVASSAQAEQVAANEGTGDGTGFTPNEGEFLPAPVTLQDRVPIDPLAVGVADEATGVVVPAQADAVAPAVKRPARRRSRLKASAGSIASSLPGQSAMDVESRQASTDSGDAHENDTAPLPFETQSPSYLEPAALPVPESLPDDAPVATTPPARQRRTRPSRRRAAQSGQASSGTLRSSDSIPALSTDISQDVLPANVSLPGITPFAAATPSVDSSTLDSTWTDDAPLTVPAQAGPEPSAGPDSQEDESAAGWAVDEPLFMSAPGGELDGAEALARSLLEMFPPVDADTEQEPTENGTSVEALENAIEPGEAGHVTERR